MRKALVSLVVTADSALSGEGPAPERGARWRNVRGIARHALGWPRVLSDEEFARESGPFNVQRTGQAVVPCPHRNKTASCFDGACTTNPRKGGSDGDPT